MIHIDIDTSSPDREIEIAEAIRGFLALLPEDSLVRRD